METSRKIDQNIKYIHPLVLCKSSHTYVGHIEDKKTKKIFQKLVVAIPFPDQPCYCKHENDCTCGNRCKRLFMLTKCSKCNYFLINHEDIKKNTEKNNDIKNFEIYLDCHICKKI